MARAHLRALLARRLLSRQLLWVNYELWRVWSKPRTERTLTERLFLRRMPKKYLRQCDLCGCQVPWKGVLGAGAKFTHGFHGVHIAEIAKIGRDCHIMHNVTIGASITHNPVTEAPIIGDRVFIGAGAAIIGRCVIGDDVRIGAGVTLVDAAIPPGATIVNKSAYNLTAGRAVYPD